MSGFSSLSLGGDASSSTTSYTDTRDPHAVSNVEARSYYAGLPSEPTLLYRTGEKWSPPSSSQTRRNRKELCEVFNHPIVDLWNDGLCWEVVEIMDNHKVFFTSMDVIRFKMVKVDEEAVEAEAKKPVVSPVTIWVGVYPGTTPATAAYKAAQAVLALLRGHEITDVDVDFCESFYLSDAGPQLHKPVGDLNPLVDVISPLTAALGLRISTRDRPKAEGTMALYLAGGGNRNKLLGLTCRHVLMGPLNANVNYSYRRSAPRKTVLLSGERSHTNLVDSIKIRIGLHALVVARWREQIEEFKEREKSTDSSNAAEARKDRFKTQNLLDDAKMAMEALRTLLGQVKKNWSNLDSRVLGHVLCSPAMTPGAGEHGFREDWGIFRIARGKLGASFQGNKINLGTKLPADKFTAKCFPRGDANWRFKFPDDRLLPLRDTISNKLMRKPDMWDLDGEPCLLVVKNGAATDITIGRANGVFSIVREYWHMNMSMKETFMEWEIINYDSKSEVFSAPGDSGSIIADIRGRIGGMLTGGSGQTHASDMTYATPFWWLLERIKATKGFTDVHLNVVE